MNIRAWLLSAIAWDGVLPLVVLAAPFVAATVFPQNDAVEISAVILVPIVAALLRASSGWRQLVNVSRGHPSAIRQVLLAAAIAVLLLFEIGSGASHRANAPWSWWSVIGALYAAYLVLILAALRPGRGGSLPCQATAGVR
jgi:hypothetical protein